MLIQLIGPAPPQVPPLNPPVVDHSSTILAILQSAIAIAGLLLVFVGFIYTRALSFPPGTDKSVTQRFITGSKWGMLPFAASVGVAVLSQVWVLFPNENLFAISMWGFLGTLIAILIYGLVTVLKLF